MFHNAQLLHIILPALFIPLLNTHIRCEAEVRPRPLDILKLKEVVGMMDDPTIEPERELLQLFQNRKKIVPVVWNNHTYLYITSKPRYRKPLIPSQAPHLSLPMVYIPVSDKIKPSTTASSPLDVDKWENGLFKLYPNNANVNINSIKNNNNNNNTNKFNTTLSIEELREKFSRAIGIARKHFRKKMQKKKDARDNISETDAKPTFLMKKLQKFVISRGSSITLPCRISDAHFYSVSWIKDESVITVDNYRYTFDERFESQHTDGSTVYDLKISYATIDDSGTYFCQVDTKPQKSAVASLSVIDAYSVIFGSDEIVIQQGSDLYLLCIVLEVNDIPDYILWYRDQFVIDYARSNVEVKTDQETRSSELNIRNVSYEDTGQYHCIPSNSKGSAVNVTVIPAKDNMNSKAKRCHECPLFFILGVTFLFFTSSFAIAFCIHKGKEVSWEREDSEDNFESLYYPHHTD